MSTALQFWFAKFVMDMAIFAGIVVAVFAIGFAAYFVSALQLWWRSKR